MSRSAAFAGSAVPCPECGTAGQRDGSSKFLAHCDTPGHCHTYTWDVTGQTVAKDVNTRAQRDANADAFDAKIRSLNPFRRSR